MASTGYATVKGVLTGDTLLLMGRSASGPPPELQLTLSGVNAPRLARGSGSVDEPFAWEARDFLRKLTLGKTVSFRVDQKAAGGGRSFGAVWLQGDAGKPESVAMTLVKAGWCLASTSKGNAEEASLAAEEEAKKAGAGAHTGDAAAKAAAVRKVQWTGADAGAIAAACGGSARALVEFVRDGSNVKCLVSTGENEYAMLNVQMAGVRCGKVPFRAPRKEGDDEAKAAAPVAPPEPFALEAKHFVETRLLHREVSLTFCGADKFGNALATLAHAASGAEIGVEVLKQGLGKVAEPGLVGVDAKRASAMRAAETGAKAAKVRVWKAYSKPSLGNIKGDFTGVVVEVVSGDQVVVADADGAEVRISLSSLKAPRLANFRAQRAGEPWSAEAKEALRHAAIGKRVAVTVEYVREIPLGGPVKDGEERPKDAKTLKLVFSRVCALPDLKKGKAAAPVPEDKQRDLAEMLLGMGLAAVNPPRNSDERASRYEQLLAAEADAKAKKLRMHSGKAPPDAGKGLIELAGDGARARTFLPYLTRAKSLRVTVEAVFSGSRFKVKVPSENCTLVFALATCRSPGGGSRDRAADFGGDAAKAYARKALLQRSVDVCVFDMDKNGVALGSLRLLPADARATRAADADCHLAAAVDADDESFESRLLARGYAKVDARRAADDARNGPKWYKLEAAARDARAGLWADEKNREAFEAAAEEKKAAKEERGASNKQQKTFRCRIADITDGAKVWLHDLPAAAEGDAPRAPSKLDAVLAKMKTFAAGPAPAAGFKRKDVVAAQFDDGSGPAWYRARVTAVGGGGAYDVRFLDFGNAELGVPTKRLSPLDAVAQALPVSAVECALVHVACAPVDDDDGEEAAKMLHDLTWGQELVATEFFDRDAPKKISLSVVGAPDDAKSINEQLVEAGLGRVPRGSKYAKDDLVKKMRVIQEKARNDRAGVWRYGDCDFSDDEN